MSVSNPVWTTEHVRNGVNRKQTVYSTENTKRLKSKSRDFFSWADEEGELVYSTQSWCLQCFAFTAGRRLIRTNQEENVGDSAVVWMARASVAAVMHFKAETPSYGCSHPLT